MKELQVHVKRLQQENNQLWAQIEKSRDLVKDVPYNGRAMRPITRNRGQEPIVPDDVDTLEDDELSLGSSSPLSLSPTKDTQGSIKEKSHKTPLQHPAFINVISGASRRVRREAGRRQNQLVQAPGNVPVLPKGATPPILPAGTMPLILLVHPTFGTRLTFYMPPTALIRRPDDMLSLPLGQHYEPPREFIIPAFATFNGSTDPYSHMLYYNQAMNLNVGNDRLLSKVFLASLQGPALA